MLSWGNANITLSWTAADTTGTYPVLNYTIYRSCTSGTETFLKVIGNLTTYTDTGLTNGQLYYYKITASNIAANSSYSNENSTIPMTSSFAPQTLTQTPVI